MKYILQLKHQCKVEKLKSNIQFDIYVNDKNVMEMEEETKEYISTKPARPECIGRELILLLQVMNRAD